MQPAPHYHPYWGYKRFGFGRLFLDFILVFLTGGLWLVWIIIRFLRSNTR